MDIHDLDSITDLDSREAFALAQGREDIVSEIDRLRKLETTHAEQDAMRRSGNHIEEPDA